MTKEEYTFAAERYLPVVVGEGSRYERICEIKKCFPEPYRRERGEHPRVMLVLMDMNKNSVRDVSPEDVHPAEPERFRESFAAHQRLIGEKEAKK